MRYRVTVGRPLPQSLQQTASRPPRAECGPNSPRLGMAKGPGTAQGAGTQKSPGTAQGPIRQKKGPTRKTLDPYNAGRAARAKA